MSEILVAMPDGIERTSGAAGLLLPVPAAGTGLTEAQARLRGMVLHAVISPHSRRNYAKALDDLFAFAAGRPTTQGATARVAGVDGRARALDGERPALGGAQAGR